MTKRVLVVDDDHAIGELARMCLELVGGFTVDLTTSGTAALTTLNRDELPDAVLLDVMMPGLDGLSLVRRLRQSERTRSLPVVLLTAKDVSREVHLGQLDIHGVLNKPFDPMTLAIQFSELLGWPEISSR